MQDLSAAERALKRRHEQVRVFAICPAPELIINTTQFWKAKEAEEAFDLMYKATADQLKENFGRIVMSDWINMILINDKGEPREFGDF